MKAVLLCAGYATRMGSLTANFPKALLPAGGRPILEDLVDQLERTDRFDEIVVVTNHRDHSHFVDWADDRSRSLRLMDDGTVSNEDRLGAIGDLDWATDELGLTGPLVVAAGDNLFRFDLPAYLTDFRAGDESLVLVERVSDLARRRRSGVAEIAPDGQLLRLWEKPDDPPSEYCCPPIYCLNAEAVEQIRHCRAELPEADAPGNLIAWLAPRMRIRTHPMRGDRLDVGDRSTYEQVEDWLRAHAPIGEPAA